MPSILNRLRDALAGQYEVERELTGGGMGLVFLARDPALDRRVAIKVLRPELATAQAAERFLREARILAKLSHPNVVPVHQAGEAGGLFYYVMEYIEGETLAERLAAGPLPSAEALKLGRDLLDGLEAAHRLGIVHRDIKPSNVFLLGDRALLSDFGVAKGLTEPTTPGTAPGVAVGTPGYMPPEQALGGVVTPRTDLYAVGMVLYEAFTGRRWSIPARPERVDWSGVPHDVVPVLRRALAWSLEERWPDAASFRRALWETRTRPYLRRTILLTSAALLAGLTLGSVLRWFDPGPRELPPSDLAILPFEVEAGADASLGRNLAHLALLNLRGFPKLTLAEERYAFAWRNNARATGDATPERAARTLRARYTAWGTVLPRGDSLEVRLTVSDSRGKPLPGQPVVRGSAADPVALGDAVARELLRAVAPQLLPGYLGVPGLGRANLAALREFFHGEDAFRANDWRRALRHYSQAVALDSTLGLALWRARNAWGWLFYEIPYPDVDLAELYEKHRHGLGTLDAALLEALLVPAGPQRFGKYEELRKRYPQDAYAALLHGNELLNRGALFGVPSARAVEVLSEAAARDSLLSPAHALLALAHIRLGNREGARRALDRLRRTAVPPEPPDPDIPAYLELAFVERFEPERAEAVRAHFFGADTARALEALTFGVRWPLYLDLPETQLSLGAALTELAGRARPEARANGHTARGLASIALGRVSRALAHFDSAAVLVPTAEARLLAAEWRVLLRALAIPGVPQDDEVARGRRELEQLASEADVGPRAAWALALDAYISRDTVRAFAWQEGLARLSRDTATEQLERILRAVQDGVRGRYAAALRGSDTLRSYYVLKREDDPFARAVLYLQRAEWWARQGKGEEAEREWLWHENFDVVGYPGGEVQAAEVDWALGTYARFRRGMSAVQRGALDSGCAHLARVADLWSDADPPLARLAREARAQVTGACRR